MVEKDRNNEGEYRRRFREKKCRLLGMSEFVAKLSVLWCR